MAEYLASQGFFSGFAEKLFPGWTFLSLTAVFALFLNQLIERWGHIIFAQFISTVEVRVLDDSYNYIMDWIAKTTLSTSNHRLLASTTLTNKEFAWSDGQNVDDQYGFDLDNDSNRLKENCEGPLKASFLNARPLRWTPAMGTHFFWHENRLLAFTRSFEDRDTIPYARRAERLFLSCIGRDATVLKNLLVHCRIEYLKKENGRLSIYRASNAGGDEVSWVRNASRPTRPMATIVLDESIKQRFISDVQRFLDPPTKHWYARRGIPYRRGYLLSGPPGTGKTSLTLAVAGMMGLGIYMINLSSPKLNEDNLVALFQNLPPSCIVLMEDIDATGLTRARDFEQEEVPDIDEGRSHRRGGISLSALLNVIDGAAAHEGRILVMTSNHANKIDSALLRPGRVDFVLDFPLGDSETATNLFKQMFDSYDEPLNGPSLTRSTTKDDNETTATEMEPAEKASSKLLSTDVVGLLARKFGEKVPALVFSPAEIQGYLLTYQNNPQEAVANVDSWVQNASKTGD